MDKKRAMRIVLLFAAAALVLASCQLAGVTQGAQNEGLAESRLLEASKAATTTIYCTASLPPECFFFEFDLDGDHKTARVLSPLDSDGYVRDGDVLRYMPIEYPLLKLAYNKQKGRITGVTAEREGISYSFSGEYSKEKGFFRLYYKDQGGRIRFRLAQRGSHCRRIRLFQLRWPSYLSLPHTYSPDAHLQCRLQPRHGAGLWNLV